MSMLKFLAKGIKRASYQGRKLDYAKKSSKMKGREKVKSTDKVIMPAKKKDKIIKSGMSEGYKFRKRKKDEIVKLNKQMVNEWQGGSKDAKALQKRISKLEEEIDKSYKVK